MAESENVSYVLVGVDFDNPKMKHALHPEDCLALNFAGVEVVIDATKGRVSFVYDVGSNHAWGLIDETVAAIKQACPGARRAVTTIED